MQWFSEMESKIKRKFKKEMTYAKIKTIGLQQDFMFGGVVVAKLDSVQTNNI